MCDSGCDSGGDTCHVQRPYCKAAQTWHLHRLKIYRRARTGDADTTCKGDDDNLSMVRSQEQCRQQSAHSSAPFPCFSLLLGLNLVDAEGSLLCCSRHVLSLLCCTLPLLQHCRCLSLSLALSLLMYLHSHIDSTLATHASMSHWAWRLGTWAYMWPTCVPLLPYSFLSASV